MLKLNYLNIPLNACKFHPGQKPYSFVLKRLNNFCTKTKRIIKKITERH